VQLRSAVVYGGVDYRTQVQTVRGGQHVLVATPGRLMGMMREQVCERERGMDSQIENVPSPCFRWVAKWRRQCFDE
jgi:superfamily II DNA/RNA helicase